MNIAFFGEKCNFFFRYCQANFNPIVIDDRVLAKSFKFLSNLEL